MEILAPVRVGRVTASVMFTSVAMRWGTPLLLVATHLQAVAQPLRWPRVDHARFHHYAHARLHQVGADLLQALRMPG
jgi:hypothetical protein